MLACRVSPRACGLADRTMRVHLFNRGVNKDKDLECRTVVVAWWGLTDSSWQTDSWHGLCSDSILPLYHEACPFLKVFQWVHHNCPMRDQSTSLYVAGVCLVLICPFLIYLMQVLFQFLLWCDNIQSVQGGSVFRWFFCQTFHTQSHTQMFWGLYFSLANTKRNISWQRWCPSTLSGIRHLVVLWTRQENVKEFHQNVRGSACTFWKLSRVNEVELRCHLKSCVL